MTLNDYQAIAHATAIYPNIYVGDGEMPIVANHAPYLYPALGLVGEAGELANKVKKIFRDHGGRIYGEIKHALVMELGDVLWYVAELATALGYTLDDVATLNESKLRARATEKTLQGSGDNR